MDLDSQPKPESKLMSLVTRTVSLFNSMDFDSLPKPLSKLISFFTQTISTDSDQNSESDLDQNSESDSDQKSEFTTLLDETLELKPYPELVSLIRQIVSIVISMNSKKLISLCPQLQVSFHNGKFSVAGEVEGSRYYKRECLLGKWHTFKLKGERYCSDGKHSRTHFRCIGCNGEYHKEYEKAPLEIKHPLHPKHSLQLVLNLDPGTRECYCCDEDLLKVFYYCSTCDYAMNIACVEKPLVSHIDSPNWHEHKLALFPRWVCLTCNVCALADSSSPIYMCPPCDFVVHLRCIKLPRVIRISRHHHRISFTPSFDQGDWSCSVCRKEINNDYGGYSCIKDGCSYAAHSRCATQSNVWDGIDLEGEVEEIEEEVVEPFVRISEGIIRHFSHEHHHLRLDENTSRDYNENRQCQACITPIYFGNFYSCVQCGFVLHETCANLSRKIYNPIHPHLLTLALRGGNDDDVVLENGCSACHRYLTVGFFYDCSKGECHFKLHLQCATISEPLIRESHVHPLFLTSKPGETRKCCVCRKGNSLKETFNCIECDDFSMCFECAVIPEKVRYKYDKHILTLSYGEATSTTMYWCEACERKIYPNEGFYMCGEYCCVTLHIKCLIGQDLYMKPGSSISYYRRQVGVMPNNHHMSRPICSLCKKRCSQKIVFQCSRLIICSMSCLHTCLVQRYL